jgi:hypothetical protein
VIELPRFPVRIESFDISHIQGAENVAGMVVCENGKMNRAEYRRFRIKTVEGANDTASMHEAVFRRYRRQLEEGKPLPDLVMIDGGKGQLNAAAAAMRELELEAIPMIGVVKPPRRHNEISHLLVKGREHEPVFLDSHSPVLRFIQLIRDETHRTAVSYHRKRRELRDFTSELTAIPGVGEKRKTRLLRNFGSIQRVAQASAAELSPFVGQKTAGEIAEHFTRQRALAEGGTAGGVEIQPAQENALDAETPLEGIAEGVVEASAIGNSEAVEPFDIETRLDDPEGEAEDLQPIRSVDQRGELSERRKRTRRRGERSSNPHGVRREKLSKSGTKTQGGEPDE